ncbi:MAG TPA: hypothetical protein VFQ44_05285, partial [Streptosporangiaceae bacterium]|nr:hypothetical protein [Streptosporangiaceae bacterium]
MGRIMQAVSAPRIQALPVPGQPHRHFTCSPPPAATPAPQPGEQQQRRDVAVPGPATTARTAR